MTIQFAWGEEVKSVGTSFIGVSPEFEIALYTLCFLSDSEETEVEVSLPVPPADVWPHYCPQWTGTAQKNDCIIMGKTATKFRGMECST